MLAKEVAKDLGIPESEAEMIIQDELSKTGVDAKLDEICKRFEKVMELISKVPDTGEVTKSAKDALVAKLSSSTLRELSKLITTTTDVNPELSIAAGIVNVWMINQLLTNIAQPLRSLLALEILKKLAPDLNDVIDDLLSKIATQLVKSVSEKITNETKGTSKETTLETKEKLKS